MSRAKIFLLVGEQWRVAGVGKARYHSASDGDEDFTLLSVTSDSHDDLLLIHRIQENVDYMRQGATVIAWAEKGYDELALSFESASLCNEIWEQITTVQQAKQSMDEVDEDDVSSLSSDITLLFPLPELSNLAELDRRINNVKGVQKSAIASRILHPAYLPRLFAVFKQIDKGCLVSEGYSMFGFCKGMFLLNEVNLLDKLMSQEIILDVISCMEYDSRLPRFAAMRTSFRTHRDFLQNAQFREPVPIKPELVKCIHLHYRLTYLRDVVMLRYWDDPSMATANSIIAANSMTLLTGLLADEEWMRTFFASFHKLAGFSVRHASSSASYMSSLKRKNMEETDELEVLEKNFQRKNLFLCLQEMCVLARSLLPPHRESFYSTLNSCGVFRALEDAVNISCPARVDEDVWVWSSVADILSNVLAHDASLIRNYLNSRLSMPTSIIGGILEAICLPGLDTGLADQLSHVIHAVIDPDLKPIEKEGFLDQFFTKHLPRITPILNPPKVAGSKPSNGNGSSVDVMCAQQQACDLLSFAISTHPVKSKQFILSQELGSKIVVLLKSARASLTCAAVRLLRACIGLEDETVSKQLCAQKAIDQLVDTFSMNGSRYNLLNSAILETLHFIRLQNVRSLVEYLVTNHHVKLSRVEYVQTFQELKLRHEQNQGGMQSPQQITGMQKELNRMLAKRQEDDEKKKRDIMLKQKKLQQKRANHNLDDEADLWGNSQAAKKLSKPKASTRG